MSTVSLDKEFISSEADLGRIGIRVVVFEKSTGSQEVDAVPIDLEEDEDFGEGDSAVNSFLELPTRGKMCSVFIMNGQRHHGLDNSLIVTDLRMKYLRKRMIIVVDLDGLSPKATSKIIQGSRSGLFEGTVYHQIKDRLVATLKTDPDLLELQEEAEEELSQLKVGDAAVQEALDQLIQEHFAGGDHAAKGPANIESKGGPAITSDGKKIHLEVVKPATEGAEASYPVLLSNHTRPTFRLHPGEARKLFISAEPTSEWAQVTEIVAVTEPQTPGLEVTLTKKPTHAVVEMIYTAPEGFDTDEYPLESKLSVLATFKGQSELRLADKLLVIKPKTYAPPPPPRHLSDDPTFVRVISRQPVRIEAGLAAAHVRMRWDGKDELAAQPNPAWVFTGVCTSHSDLASISFSTPASGRFEALIHVHGEVLIGSKLKFDIRANGPHGKQLTTSIEAEISAPLEAATPRKAKTHLPAGGERRPPYKLMIVTEETFSSHTRWGEETWDSTHAGAFIDPKADAPLTLCINQDLGLLKAYLDGQVAKKADEQRTEEKKTKYISHIAYHLYQMYLHKEKVLKQKAEGTQISEPKDEDMQDEVNRVAGTLIRLMEVSR